MKKTKTQKRIRRHARVRAKIKGTSERPRISVYKSNKHTFVQAIDDVAGKTIFSSDISKGKSKTKKTKTENSFSIGEVLAEKMKKAGITEAVFDRGGFKFHGRVKSVAEGLKKGGIKV